MRSLRDRLQLYKAGQSEPSTSQNDAFPIEALLPGHVEVTPYGPCYYREVRYDSLTKHGKYLIAQTRHRKLDLLAQMCKSGRSVQKRQDSSVSDPVANTLDLWERVCFFDTETSGLGTGAGNFIFLWGFGYLEEDDFVVRQYFLRSHMEERAILYALCMWLARFDTVISYNGKGFDWKLLESRMTLSRLPVTLPTVRHLDLLPFSRRLWKKRLINCKLATVEREILTVQRMEDIPGKMAPELYFAYASSGDARPLQGVFSHNVLDVLSLVTLAAQLCDMIDDPLEGGYHPEELLGISRWYEEWALQEASRTVLSEIAATSDEDGYRREAWWRMSMSFKREGHWEEAISLWSQLVQETGRWQIAGAIEWAKYLEHKIRDYEAAHYRVATALEQVIKRKTIIRTTGRSPEEQELRYRLARLDRKRSDILGVQGLQ